LRDPATSSERQRLIDGMARIDTSTEDVAIRHFQGTGNMPDLEKDPAGAWAVVTWCLDHQVVDQFLLAAQAYGKPRRHANLHHLAGERVELEFKREHITPEHVEFFIAVLPRCPQIKAIELPIPATSAQASRLAKALELNSGLKRLELHMSEAAPADSTTVWKLFSHYNARASALSELRIDMKDKPAGDTDWMRALCEALSTHLRTESARLTLPWRDGHLKLLAQAILASPCLSSLILGGDVPNFGMQDFLPALENPACQLTSLSFPDSSFDQAVVEMVIKAVERNRSLTQLDLGETPLTPGQREQIATALWNNKNIAAWESLGGVAWV
jgi:hypothetical protein